MKQSTKVKKPSDSRQRKIAVEAIKKGLEDIKNRKGTDIEEFFREFFAKNNIPLE